MSKRIMLPFRVDIHPLGKSYCYNFMSKRIMLPFRVDIHPLGKSYCYNFKEATKQHNTRALCFLSVRLSV